MKKCLLARNRSALPRRRVGKQFRRQPADSPVHIPLITVNGMSRPRKRKAEEDEAEGIGVYCDEEALCLEGCDIVVPLLESSVDGMWGLVRIDKSENVPSIVSAHLYNHIFWRADWPVKLCLKAKQPNGV